MEVWKDIEGYEGHYQVSNYGRVRSLDRYVQHKRYGRQLHKGRIMAPVKKKRGENYLSVGLTKGTNRKNFFIHQLVANAFIDNPENKPQVNHIDENPQNNHADNLEWVTAYENMHHNDLCYRIEQPGKKKVNAYDKQGNLVHSFDSIYETRKHGFNAAAVSHAVNGRAKTSGGYIWKIE